MLENPGERFSRDAVNMVEMEINFKQDTNIVANKPSLENANFWSERFPLPLGAWDGLRHFIVALPEHSL